MLRHFFSIISLLAIALCSNAQVPVMTINGKPSDKEVYLQKLDVNINVVGNVATTSMTMTFKNISNKVLEGELTFPLPDGATVRRYALDINGKMREAVPVDKAKGTQVFEAIERRRVDPGLLEKVEGNNFRTRVYPLNPNSSRTITVGYEQELTMAGNSLQYKLPMDYRRKIEQFNINATVWKSAIAPKLETFSDEIIFDKEGANYVAKFSRTDYTPQSILSIVLPKQEDVAEILMQPAGDSYYFLVNSFVKDMNVAKKWDDNIGIIWDASLSGLQRNVKKELDLLGVIIDQKKNVTIRVGLLNNTFTNAGTFNIINGNWSGLRKMLESVVYDGGTNFSAINTSLIASGEYILFSDGISSFGDQNFEIKSVMHCVVSSPRSNFSSLKWIALKSGGKFVNLNELSQQETKKLITEDHLQFMGIKNNSGANVREVYPSIATDLRNGNISVAGITDADKTSITLLFGIGGKVIQQQVVQPDAARHSGDNSIVSRMWAQKKITEMDIQYEKNKEDIIALGQQFGIVTRGTSLIVLETLQDYITYNIAPPEELQVEYAKYMQQQKGRNISMQRNEVNLLNHAKDVAIDLKQWWNTTFKIVPPKYPTPNKGTVRYTPPQIIGDSSVNRNAVAAAPMADMVMDRARNSDAKLEEAVVVTGFSNAKKEGSYSTAKVSANELRRSASFANVPAKLQDKQPEITIADIKEDRDYLKKLTGDSKKDYQLYLDLRKTYSNTATFYFDMAKWFWKLKDSTTAIRVLSSIADMELENAGLFKTLAFRLKEYGDYKDELFVTKKIMEWRPMEPQSYRDYALALADNEQYQAALDTLYGALTRSYTPETANKGIVEVFITEINQLITHHGNKLNYRKIDTSLIKAMPVDVRVVISWNMNDTDIDLHVTDPYGEECFYGNSGTAIGGRISSDITTGYGPEQFQLKKAVKGKYKIKVNYFGDRQVKNEGPSTVMAEIYTNYSNGSQTRKVISLQMSGDMKSTVDGKVLVGEFTF